MVNTTRMLVTEQIIITTITTVLTKRLETIHMNLAEIIQEITKIHQVADSVLAVEGSLVEVLVAVQGAAQEVAAV